MQKTNFREQFTNVADACALAQSIVDTVREPLIVLDKELRVIAASRSFYSAFEVSDLLPNLPSLIGRVCSSFAPDWGVLRTRLV